MAEMNPYAPPRTDATDAVSAKNAAKLEKARRTNLINRRTVALLIDSLPYAFFITIPFSSLLSTGGVKLPGATWLLTAPLYLFRDAFGGAGFGKRLVGLRVAGPGPDAPATLGARIVRGLPLIVPSALLIEYFVAYYGNETMQRIGDMLAGTRVVDIAPERHGKSSWSWQLLVAGIVTGSLYVFESAAVLQLLEGFARH